MLFRVHQLTKPLRGDGRRLYKIVHADGKEEVTNKMPLRDCKTTGYRLAPSIDEQRIETVRTIYELWDSGLNPRQISKHLWARGVGYFGRPFKDNAIWAILNQPAYVGRPAWGKVAVGAYKHVLNGRSEDPKERKREDPINYHKDDEHRIYPLEPVFDPETFMPVKLWERVQTKLNDRPVERKPNRRNQANHPLNGKICCPDCDAPMVIGSATARDGTKQRYFICGTYTKNYYEKCSANSVRWDKLDRASAQVLERAKAELAKLQELDLDQFTTRKWESDSVECSRRALRLLFDMAEAQGMSVSVPEDLPFDPFGENLEDLERYEAEMTRFVVKVLKGYKASCEKTGKQRAKRLAEVEKEIDKLGELIEEARSERLRKRWYDRVEQLETERQRLESGGATLFDQWQTAREHAAALERTIGQMEKTRDAALWDVFLEKVVPIMRVETMRDGRQRRHVEGFRFVAKNSVKDALFDALEICATRTGRDSRPQ